MTECGSCKEERTRKKLPPAERIILPLEVTETGFRKIVAPTYVCAYCDGETLVTSALRQHAERQAE